MDGQMGRVLKKYTKRVLKPIIEQLYKNKGRRETGNFAVIKEFGPGKLLG